MDSYCVRITTKFYRVLALFLALILLATTLIACSNKNSDLKFEDSKHHNTICEYIESKILTQWSHSRSDERFISCCAYSLLGSDENYIYVVFAGDDFILLEGDGVASANACVIPARLEYTSDADGFRILSHDCPGDGAAYAADMARLFPQSAMDKLEDLRIANNNIKLAEAAYKRACEKLGVEYVEGSCINYDFEERSRDHDD